MGKWGAREWESVFLCECDGGCSGEISILAAGDLGLLDEDPRERRLGRVLKRDHEADEHAVVGPRNHMSRLVRPRAYAVVRTDVGDGGASEGTEADPQRRTRHVALERRTLTDDRLASGSFGREGTQIDTERH